jgi:hypothetical protein
MTQAERDKLMEAVARRHFNVDTLEERSSDKLDFHECHVRGIKDALTEAFEAGEASTQPKVFDVYDNEKPSLRIRVKQDPLVVGDKCWNLTAEYTHPVSKEWIPVRSVTGFTRDSWRNSGYDDMLFEDAFQGLCEAHESPRRE